MAKRANLKVKLLSYTKNPEQTVVAAIRQCYSAVGAKELKQKTSEETRKRLIGQILASGHTSTVEHASFTFAIEGISRACSHQLVRHRLASYSMQSQRYVDLTKKGVEYVMPPAIKAKKELAKAYEKIMADAEKKYAELIGRGINPEDARMVLPAATETKLVVTMNTRSLWNFFQQRCCLRAQWEIRALAMAMLSEVKKVAPELFAGSGPSCEGQKICWEGNLSCGKWRGIKGAMLRSRVEP